MRHIYLSKRTENTKTLSFLVIKSSHNSLGQGLTNLSPALCPQAAPLNCKIWQTIIKNNQWNILSWCATDLQFLQEKGWSQDVEGGAALKATRLRLLLQRHPILSHVRPFSYFRDQSTKRRRRSEILTQRQRSDWISGTARTATSKTPFNAY